MKSTLLDLSKHADLEPFARVIADVLEQANALNVPALVTGAFARDLHLLYAHNIKIARQTDDVDIALAVLNWETFDALKQRLIATSAFVDVRGAAQRLVHKSGLPLDLVPFGGVETGDRNIAWPPDGAFRMNLFGYQEAVAAAVPARLPEGVDISLVSLAGLALLKIVAWGDRHHQAPRKDAYDLMLIAQNYLNLGNEDRLWSEFPDWADEPDFDVARSSARMLGVDIRQLLKASGRTYVANILRREADPLQSDSLAREMAPHDPDFAQRLLAQMLWSLED